MRATAEETNALRYLLERGQTGLSVAFDPTQLGYDSDDPLAEGEVGRTGVAIDSLADMEALLDGIPLDRVSTSMTINAPCGCCSSCTSSSPRSRASTAVGCAERFRTTCSRSTSRAATTSFPTPVDATRDRPLRVLRRETPRLQHDLDLRVPHPGSRCERGARASFTLANGIAYCEAAVAALSRRLRRATPRSSSTPTTISSRRSRSCAARRLWAEIMRDRFGATNPRALALRFHAQTGGSTLTAQQPENNIVRVAAPCPPSAAAHSRCTRTRSTKRWRSRPSTQRRSPSARQILAGGRDDRHGGSVRRLVLHRGAHRRARAARAHSSRKSTTSAAQSLRSSRASSRPRSRRRPSSSARGRVGRASSA